MFRFTQRGSFKNFEEFERRNQKHDYISDMHDIGRIVTKLLAIATPKDTGKTAASWGYIIEEGEKGPKISWYNDNVNDGVLIALIIQYGHATGTGGYVPAIDYINPVIEPIFGKMADDFWKEVTK